MLTWTALSMTPILFVAPNPTLEQLEQILLNCLIAGASYALISVGFNVIYSTSKVYDFGYGGAYTFGAYLSWSLSAKLGMTFGVSALITVCAVGLIGCVVELLLYAPMRNKGATPLLLMLASLGMYIVMENAIVILWGSGVKADRPSWVRPIEWMHARITSGQLAIVLVSVALMVAITLGLHFTRRGLGLRAVASNPMLARLNGLAVSKFLLGARSTGYMLASFAGVMVALDKDLVPTIGFSALLVAIVAAIMGGIGSYGGAVAGGLILAFVESLTTWYLSSEWQNSAAFLVLLLVLLFRPRGLFSRSPGG